MSTAIYDCAIVGGGLVGGTLAVALAAHGLTVVLADRADAATRTAEPWDGRASAIAFASQRMLERIGLWAGMAQAAEPILDIRVSDGPSLLFLHYDHRAVGQPFGWIVENRATRLAQAERLSGLAGLTELRAAAVKGFAREPGAVALGLDDGTVLRARLLVAADGADSALRRQAGIAAAQWRYNQTAIVCTMGHERPHRGVAHERFLPAGPFAVLPMTDDPVHGHRSSIVWTERAVAAAHFLALGDAAFGHEMARRFGDWLGAVRVLGGRWSYPLRLLHAETYVQPRFALIGDAAHAIHPIAGQGLNLGLRDVAALAQTLIEARRLGLDIGALDVLRRYERWRRFDNQALIVVTDGLNRLFSNDLAPLRLARDLGMAAVNRLPGLKRLLMRHAMGTVGELPKLLKGEAI